MLIILNCPAGTTEGLAKESSAQNSKAKSTVDSKEGTPSEPNTEQKASPNQKTEVKRKTDPKPRRRSNTRTEAKEDREPGAEDVHKSGGKKLTILLCEVRCYLLYIHNLNTLNNLSGNDS